MLELQRMKFKVTIRKEGAPDTERVVEAASRLAVYSQIQKDEGTVLKVTKLDNTFQMPSWLFISFGSGVKHAEIIRFAKNLSAMLNAGLSLARALSVIERQSSNKRMRAIMNGISESIKKGASFHDSLTEYPKVFSELFTAMVRAGEESGSLTDSLKTVAVQMERSEELIKKIRGAMIYPSIVITAIVIVGILMLMFVVPTLTATFTELHVKLPMATQVIVAISNLLINNALLVLIGMVAAVVGGIGFIRSKTGGSVFLTIGLHTPVIGELVRETYSARAARTLSSLLSAGVPVLEALAITKEVVHAPKFARVIEEAEARVKKGELLSAAFAEHVKLFPILMSDMLMVGEETGNVTEMLKQIAEFYEQDVSEKTKDLSTIIEPVLMLLIGGAVGVFAVAIISPIYSLSSAF